jgi:hypothetical protein
MKNPLKHAIFKRTFMHIESILFEVFEQALKYLHNGLETENKKNRISAVKMSYLTQVDNDGMLLTNDGTHIHAKSL